jgi:hypothetical protein
MPLGDHGRAPDQQRARQSFVGHDLHRAEHALVFAFGIGHPRHGDLRQAFGGRENRLHRAAGLVDELIEALPVGLHVGNRARGHSAVHGRLRNRRCDGLDQSGSKGLGMR